jgi:ribonuclease BN (tRNA processing enzyme)
MFSKTIDSRLATVLLVASGLFAAAGPAPAQTDAPKAQADKAPAATGKVRLILLGTAAGPTPKLRNQPANALIVNGKTYVIDAGDGVVRQMFLAKIPMSSIRAVFITHNHSDHNADYGNLLFLSWAGGRRNVIDTYGPPPLEKMTRLFIEMNDWDIKLRQDEEHRPDFASLVKAHDFGAEGEIYRDENVKVSAFLVEHYGAKPSYGFRFETQGKAIVFSGDTSPSENLVKHAKGADLLVHEVVNEEGVAELVNRIDPGNEGLKDHIIKAHTPTTQVGRIASAAQVRKLVLSHFAPSGGPFDKDELWLKDAQKDYKGPIVIARDLMEIDLE